MTIEEIVKKQEVLEGQNYILYLQLNSISRQLIENGTIDKDKLVKDMDELNDQLFEIANQELEATAPVEAAPVEAAEEKAAE